MAKPLLNTRIDGLAGLNKAFAEMPKAFGRGVLRTALRKAAKPVPESMKSLAPVDDGDLRDSIRIGPLNRRQRSQSRARRGKLDVELSIGPTQPEGAHGLLVEFGTGPRFDKNGKFVGAMPAQPFARPAWDIHKQAVLKRFGGFLGQTLERKARSLRRRAQRGKRVRL